MLDDKRKTPCCLMAAWGFAMGDPRSNYFDLLAIRLIEYSLPYYLELIEYEPNDLS